MKRLMLVSLCALTFGLGSTGNIKAMDNGCCGCWGTVKTDLEAMGGVVLKGVTTVAQVAITTVIQTLEAEGGADWTALKTACQSSLPVPEGSSRIDLAAAHVLLNDDFTVKTVVKALVLSYLQQQQVGAALSPSTSAASTSAVAMTVASNKV